MKTICTISGVAFTIPEFNKFNVVNSGIHPIFYTNYSNKCELYSEYTKGRLLPFESYLLFVAFLDETGLVIWDTPLTCNPNSTSIQTIIANYFNQLIEVVNKSAIIKHPSFKQPAFKVTIHNSELQNIGNWIKSWQENIESFMQRKASQREMESLVKLENRLKRLILANEDPRRYGHILAQWADKSAPFPHEVRKKWYAIIHSCYNSEKMFSTPLVELRALLDHCECKIEVGSLYYKTLIATIKRGIHNHTDYLGIGDLGELQKASNSSVAATAITDSKLTEIAMNAPTKEPVKADYPTLAEYLTAKSAWMVARNSNKVEELEKTAKAAKEILAKRKNPLDL